MNEQPTFQPETLDALPLVPYDTLAGRDWLETNLDTLARQLTPDYLIGLKYKWDPTSDISIAREHDQRYRQERCLRQIDALKRDYQSQSLFNDQDVLAHHQRAFARLLILTGNDPAQISWTNSTSSFHLHKLYQGLEVVDYPADYREEVIQVALITLITHEMHTKALDVHLRSAISAVSGPAQNQWFEPLPPDHPVHRHRQ